MVEIIDDIMKGYSGMYEEAYSGTISVNGIYLCITIGIIEDIKQTSIEVQVEEGQWGNLSDEEINQQCEQIDQLFNELNFKGNLFDEFTLTLNARLNKEEIEEFFNMLYDTLVDKFGNNKENKKWN